MAGLVTTSAQRRELLRWCLFNRGQFGGWATAFRLHSGTPPTDANRVSTSDSGVASSVSGNQIRLGPAGGRIAVPIDATSIAAIALWYRKAPSFGAPLPDNWSLLAYEPDAYSKPVGVSVYRRLAADGWTLTFPRTGVFGGAAFSGLPDQGGAAGTAHYPWFERLVMGANAVTNVLNGGYLGFTAHSSAPPTGANWVGGTAKAIALTVPGVVQHPFARDDALVTVAWTGTPRILGPNVPLTLSRRGTGGLATHWAAWFLPGAGEFGAPDPGPSDLVDGALVCYGPLENAVNLATAGAEVPLHANALSIQWNNP